MRAGNLGRFVSIRPNEVRLLKSKAAEREVPLHGLLERLLDTALPTSGRLFPGLTVDRVVKRYELRPVFRTVCLLTLRGHFPSHIFESLFWRFVADA